MSKEKATAFMLSDAFAQLADSFIFGKEGAENGEKAGE
jgi:hypothetical protein